MSEEEENQQKQQQCIEGEGEKGQNILEFVNNDQVGKIVQFLRKNKDQIEEILLTKNSAGHSLLYWACHNGKFVLVEYLIKKGKRIAFGFTNKKGLLKKNYKILSSLSL